MSKQDIARLVRHCRTRSSQRLFERIILEVDLIGDTLAIAVPDKFVRLARKRAGDLERAALLLGYGAIAIIGG